MGGVVEHIKFIGLEVFTDGGGRGTIENQLRYLTTLNSGAVGALRRALELKGDRAHGHLAHALLTKVAKFGPVEYSRSRVERFGFDLYGIIEVHVESLAGSVREELRVAFGEHASLSLQFDFHVVIGGAV